MGILSALLGDANPAAVWAAQNRGWLGQVGAGFGSGTSFSDGLAQAAAMGPQGQRVDDAYRVAEEQKAERQRAINQTSEYLRNTFPDLAEAVNAGMPMDAAWNEAMKRKQPGYGQQAQADLPASIQEYNFYAGQAQAAGETPMPYNEWRQGSNQTVRAGVGQPIFGKNRKTGQIEPWQSMTDGTMINTANPDASPMDYDFSPSIAATERSAGTIAGKTTTEAAVNLPNTVAQAEQSLQNLAGLLPEMDPSGNPVPGTNKGFDEQFGTVGFVPQQWMGALDGSEKAGFQSRIRQVQGEAFLTAITQLKGLGALSDAEGQTATKAITRISEKLPQKEFVAAVKELADIVRRGIKRAKDKALLSPVAGDLGVTAPSAAGSRTTSTGVTYSVGQ